MAAKSILVVGANRGIGLNLLRVFGLRGWKIYGSIRPETKGDESVNDLKALGATVLEIDFKDEKTIIEAVKAYGSRPLDVLINCGGIGVEPESFVAHTAELLIEQLQIMAVGPFLTTKHFLPNLEASPFAKLVNISSAFGSISGKKGGYLGYKMAKAALNQQTRTFAKDMQKQGKNICAIMVHPGAVATKLSGWNFDDDLVECCTSMVNLIEGLTMERTGDFMDFDGKLRAF